MTILGIETSCDETGASLVQDGTKILSNIIASSQELHIKTGGIVPEVAAREQIKCLLPVIKKALESCEFYYYDSNHSSVDTLAVTVGPGLIGSLLVGVETAKTLAYLWQKPIIPVNHLTAHLYANWLKTRRTTNKNTNNHESPQFPAVGLIASGGHTDLVLMKSHTTPATPAHSAGGRGKIKWLGGTRDDAAGEAFDKIARLLGLAYPGGPAIAKEAEKFAIRKLDNLTIRLPRPMVEGDNFDFSFSGLKTAVLREVNQLKTIKQFNNEAVSYLAYEIQESITDVLVEKTLRAAQVYRVHSILLGGGVAANQRLRDKFSLKIENLKLKIKLFIPEKSLCTDNAAIIASCAYFNNNPTPWQKIQADPGLYF